MTGVRDYGDQTCGDAAGGDSVDGRKDHSSRQNLRVGWRWYLLSTLRGMPVRAYEKDVDVDSLTPVM